MARVEPSREIWHRDDFADLCNWRKLWRAVEVGVDRGVFAERFLRRWIGHEWWGVDAWKPYEEMDYDRDPDYRFALARIAPHSDRAKVIRLPSIEAAERFGRGSVDFVYIDGKHDRDSVAEDLAAWFPKIAPGGILAGHDFDDKPEHDGVKQAVCDFAEAIDRTVYLTAVEGYIIESCPSWYLYVDGMPGPDWRRC